MKRDPQGTSAAEPDGGNLHVRIQRGPGLGNWPGLLNKVTTLGIDVAKNIFQLHGVDEREKVVLTRRVSRGKLMDVMANLPTCLVVRTY